MRTRPSHPGAMATLSWRTLMAGLHVNRALQIKVSLGFKLLPNGNMVLYDSKGNFTWQSFDSPTDTLLVGQSLRAGPVSKLVSRASKKDNSNGPYSPVIEPKQLSIYYTSENSPKPLLYYTFARHV
ncbi:hypothetical protein NL676_024027 [Syzygium grande]|nr:hypothetical protein NL676_024027 [Syzygium grande]